MLVRPEDTLWTNGGSSSLLSWDFDDMYSSTVLHNDDIWKKFEFLDLPPTELTPTENNEDMDKQLDNLLEWSLEASTKTETSEIRHHDCMWAGHCGSKEHKPDQKVLIPTTPVIIPPKVEVKPTIIVKKPSVNTPVVVSSRSLLRTKITQNMNNNQNKLPIGPRPDSPPSSDDDDHPRFKHEISEIFNNAPNEDKTLQFLHDAISECDFEDDSDLCDYLEEDMFGSEDGSTKTRSSYPGESDHCYHKGKEAQLRMDHLGVQTPSDSGKSPNFHIDTGKL